MDSGASECYLSQCVHTPETHLRVEDEGDGGMCLQEILCQQEHYDGSLYSACLLLDIEFFMKRQKNLLFFRKKLTLEMSRENNDSCFENEAGENQIDSNVDAFVNSVKHICILTAFCTNQSDVMKEYNHWNELDEE